MPMEPQQRNTILYFILAVVTTLGNAVVVLAVYRDPYKQLRKNLASYLIAGLAVSNLVLVVGEILQAAGNIIYGKNAYNTPSDNGGTLNGSLLGADIRGTTNYRLEIASDFTLYFAMATSVLTVLVLATERLVVLRFGYEQRVTKKRIIFSVSIVWFLSFALAVPRAAFEDEYKFREQFIIVFALIILLIIFINLWIYANVKRACSITELQPLAHGRLNALRIRKRNRAAARTIAYILVALVTLWTPTIITEIFLYFPGYDLKNELVEFIYLIGCVNAAVDPGIYAFRTPVFRRALSGLLKKTDELVMQQGRYVTL
ncbi:adrenocorticotropic hormone receptor [Nematostella vectensis]|uniref:adrenocorticotropic hormone receptor n=1 Tax=Nematostella vectensis TaxID=45351 RepID=UPI0020778C34|nr:adrenocorticotropic hormone receptor [Nematostella vectensis]